MKRSPVWTPATVVAMVLGLLACATTTFDSTWRAPDARPLQLTGKKVAGLVISKNEALRRSAEDAMAREISAHGAQGVAAYTLFDTAEIKDQAKVRAKLDSLGFSGIVVMRLAGKETHVNYSPAVYTGPYYGSFWGGYWGYGWGYANSPGYITTDQVVKVETLVYSLEQDKLVWAGVSRTVDPTKIDSFISEIAKAVANQMEKDGLLPKG